MQIKKTLKRLHFDKNYCSYRLKRPYNLEHLLDRLASISIHITHFYSRNKNKNLKIKSRTRVLCLWDNGMLCTFFRIDIWLLWYLHSSGIKFYLPTKQKSNLIFTRLLPNYILGIFTEYNSQKALKANFWHNICLFNSDLTFNA